MGPEDLLVDHAAPSQGAERLCHGTAVSGVGHRGGSPPPGVPHPPLRGVPKRLGRQLPLGISEMLDPPAEIVVLHRAAQRRQFQVGVEVHQSRQDHGVREINGRGTFRMRHPVSRTHLRNLPVFINKNGPVENHGAGHRIHRPGGDPQQVSARRQSGAPGRSTHPEAAPRPSC